MKADLPIGLYDSRGGLYDLPAILPVREGSLEVVEVMMPFWTEVMLVRGVRAAKNI